MCGTEQVHKPSKGRPFRALQLAVAMRKGPVAGRSTLRGAGALGTSRKTRSLTHKARGRSPGGILDKVCDGVP